MKEKNEIKNEVYDDYHLINLADSYGWEERLIKSLLSTTPDPIIKFSLNPMEIL